MQLPLRAALTPYTVDADTLHLWHLDESETPCVNAAGGTNLMMLGGDATLGNLSFPGFGTALSTVDGGTAGGNMANQIDAHLSPRTLANNGTDNVAWSFSHPATGAFTFEALVWIGFDPALKLGATGSGGTGRNAPMQIISGEQDGSGGGVRSWQFRLDPVGLIPNADGYTTPLTQPALEFINVNNGSSVQHFIALIPTNGVDAIASNQWYHVAVAYDGNASTPDNLRLYWTLLESNRHNASLLASRSMNLDLNNSGAVDFCVGNTGRTTPNNNFIGLVDELRISSVARSATNFYWQPPPPVDDDEDGLPDWWEILYFTNIIAYAATNDPDSDLFDNLAEYNASSNPTNIFSTPLDTDADGLPDEWERTHFNSLTQGPLDDPDGDGFNNLAEHDAGTAPNNAAFHPNGTDGDGLPDAWEQQHFGSLAPTATGDFDGDGYSNLQEFQSGTNPANAASFPAAPAVTFYPIEDGDPHTSEFGYAGSSSINAVSFTRSSLMTLGDQQFIAYYGRHATDAGYAFNNHVWIGRRHLATNVWELHRTAFTANDITDGHDVVSFGIDGEGYMHLSWGMHGNPFHYSRSTNAVTSNLPIGFGPDTTMTGAEGSVTYPQFLTLPDGDLLYLFREGGSGSGDTYLNRYNLVTRSWTNVHYSGGQQMFIKGRGAGWSPDYNAYPNMPQLDADGNFYLTWTWRYNSDSPAGESGYQTNHDFDYARSTNGGLTWLRQDGTPYTLLINERGENGDTNSIAERILSIPEGSSLINQASMCLDAANQPVIASWWAPGAATNNHQRQYMVAFPGPNPEWEIRQVSNRTNDLPDTKYSEGAVRNLGRPIVVADRDDRLIVAWRDNFVSNGLTVAYCPPRTLDPQRTNWTTMDLTTANLGSYESQIDWDRWQRDNVLQFLYQPAAGEGYTPPANTASPIGVLEWNAAAWFAHRPALRLAIESGTNAVLTFNAQPGWGYRVQTSTDLTVWETLTTFPGTMGERQYTHTNSVVSEPRYWRLEIREGGY
jgi:hypothetical protein